MEQLERIRRMEAILNRGTAAMEALQQALDACEALAPEIEALAQYYESDSYREDLRADEAGRLPRDLPRGILSEDGIWNLLADWDCRFLPLRDN